MSLTLPAKELEQSIDKKISQLKRKVSIAGFRKDKVPPDIVRQHYGDRLLSEAGNDLMRDSFLKVIMDEKINLAGVRGMEPKQLAFGKDFIFEVNYEILPKVDLRSPAGKIEKIIGEIREEDVDEVIEKMRRSRMTLENAIIGVPACEEHIVTLDYESEPLSEGGKKTFNKDVVIDLSASFPEPRFIAALIGMKEGDRKSFRLMNEEKKERIFHVTMKKVQRKVIPELDGVFYKQFGMDNDEKGFRAQVRKGMEHELGLATKQLLKERAYEALLAEHENLEVPETQVQREMQKMRDEIAQQLARRTGEKELADENEKLTKIFRAQAEKKVKLGLLLVELAQKHAIQIQDEQVEERIKEIASSYQQPTKVEEHYRKNKELQEQVKNALLEEKTIETFLMSTNLEEKTHSYHAVMELINKPQSHNVK